MTYHMRDMKNLGRRPPETLTDALLALACAAPWCSGSR